MSSFQIFLTNSSWQSKKKKKSVYKKSTAYILFNSEIPKSFTLKSEVKQSSFTGDVIVYVENPK